jgi:hypothetical protein
LPVSTGLRVVDLIRAEDRGTLCEHCSDPIDRGEIVAVLSNGEQVHDDGCRPSVDEHTRQKDKE